MHTPKKILVVDDEPINLEFFEVMLSKLGFTVEKAEDGVEALDKVKRFFPDLVILDVIMPRMSGWEVIKVLKGDPKYRDIPIVMLSALDDVKEKVEGFELGIEDYITKPFNFSEVLARIRAALRNRELFAQIAVRESRLSLAEELSVEVKNNLLAFAKSIDELDAAIALFSQKGEKAEEVPRLLALITDKTAVVRKNIAELDARIEKTYAEWENLKKTEIGIGALESHLRRSLPRNKPHGES
jgi:DNA-binding response OmpR family regulator